MSENNLTPVEKLPKTTGLFTNYIYKTIPLAFDESMSYYETLCGLLSYLKDTVKPAIDNNADALAELQNYVAHYFDNLDVTEEINNKLDQMAEDGSLGDLIGAYINPIIQNQNNVINNFMNQTSTTITQQNEQITSLQNNTETTLNNQNQSINTLDARVTALSSLTEGSTTGDAELTDIRTAFNGVTYSSAGNAVRAQAGNNNAYITGVRQGGLIDPESIKLDKLNVDNNLTVDKYVYEQASGASVSAGYLTYIHVQTATTATLKAKIVMLTDAPSFKVATRISGTSYFFGQFTNLKQGDELYINKTIDIPTSTEATIRVLYLINDTTVARSFEVYNPIFTQNTTTNPVGTYGYETAAAGTCTHTDKTYKALATKEYVQNAVSGGTIFSSMNFGCSGDSITAESENTHQWPYYVCDDLSLQDEHNTAVGSSTYAFKKVTYNGVDYTPQSYTDVNFAGYSTKSASQVENATEAQQVANNCAKCHIEQFIAEVSAGTYEVPDIFIFAYGTNDNVNNIGSVEDAFSDSLANIDKFTMAGGMRYAIEKITTAYPNCQVFVLNILQSAYQGNQARSAQLAKNAVIKEMADYFSIPVIDQYDECGITRLYEVAGTQGIYLSDGLHPNTAGRKKQAEYIVRCLKNKTTDTIS